MPQTIICSVGTSAAKGIAPPSQILAWVDQQGGGEAAAGKLFASVKDIPPTGEALWKSLSAEVHSLVRIGLTARDRVVLLASETPDGQACSLAVKLYLEQHFSGIECNS
ncbi:MAG: putative CRISPR-associated protein, partial [Gemmataceae bacterium]